MQIKAMPVSMMQKKELKAKLQVGHILVVLCCIIQKQVTDSVNSFQTATKLRLQGFEQFKWQRRKVWQQMKSRWKETYSKLELWRHSLKKIEGTFGTGIVAYFLFIKWLMFLNLFIFLFILLFIIIPTVVLVSHGLSKNNTDDECTRNSSDSSVDFNFLDFVQATGSMEQTFAFYGFYPEKLVSADGVTHLYNLPLAYVAITVVYLLGCLAVIVKSAAQGFKERLIEGEGQFYQYCNLVFGGWDYCIHSEKSARMKQKALYSEMKACLEAERLEEERQNRSRDEMIKLVIIRCIINLICLVVLSGALVLIYYAFDFSQEELRRIDFQNPSTDLEHLHRFVLEFLPSITIVGLNLLVPNLFAYLVSFERYSPLFVVRLTLLRTVLLRLASLIMLMVSLNNSISNKGCPQCWETYVGQQIYKLVILDFVIHVLITFTLNWPRMLIAKYSKSKVAKLVGEQEFDLPSHVLDVVYSQSLCWLGSFYAPVLPLMAVLKCFLLFHIKKFACLVNSKPSSVVYRASRSKSLFMMVLLILFIVAVVPVAYAIAEIEPSKFCGPFRGLSATWSAVVDSFEQLPVWIKSILFFFGTAGFAIPVFIVLVLCLYYFYAVSAANKQMVMVLKNQLVLEGHDKQFLLNRLSAFIKQQQEHQKAMRHVEMTNLDLSSAT